MEFTCNNCDNSFYLPCFDEHDYGDDLEILRDTLVRFLRLPENVNITYDGDGHISTQNTHLV